MSVYVCSAVKHPLHVLSLVVVVMEKVFGSILPHKLTRYRNTLKGEFFDRRQISDLVNRRRR